jgi:hypothetical protein
MFFHESEVLLRGTNILILIFFASKRGIDLIVFLSEIAITFYIMERIRFQG